MSNIQIDDVLQGSVLESLLFVIYINGLETSLQMKMKIGGGVLSKEDCLRLQQDVDQMESWAKHRQMDFNLDKYKVMQFGKSIQAWTCTVNGRVLRNVDEQRDHGVQVHVCGNGLNGEKGMWSVWLHR